MSDNDTISRKAVKDLIKEATHAAGDAKTAKEMFMLYREVANLPAVPDEMSAREFMKLRSRICHEQYINRQSDDDWLCDGCVLKACCSPADSEGREAEAVAIVENWAREHPERKEGGAG